MRYLSLFILAGLCASAQDFLNGQAARVVIGQPTFTAATPEPASQYVIGGVGGLAYANNALYVADSSKAGATPVNNRVLVYQNLSSIVPDKNAAFPQGGRCPACVGPATLVLGQPDFATTDLGLGQGMRLPTAVASDGTMLAVADTDNNRVLLWRSIPTTTNQAPDVVLGQKDLSSVKPPTTTNSQSLKGPQGVWFQNGKLFVADTMNHRVLIWNSVPTQNEAAADLVLGQANFNVAEQPATDPDPDKQTFNAQANTMLNPVSVTSDGVRLYVTDLGHNRVLIFNSIPTQNQASADVVIGQPDFQGARSNNVAALCAPIGTNEDGTPQYPGRCASTMNFPRFALSDGQRLFVADGGNDRVMVYKSIPTTNGQPCDSVLGQLRTDINNNSDSASPASVAASDALRAPMSLAWDGQNLYVSDSYNRRIMAFTNALNKVPYNGVKNSASWDTFAVGGVTFALPTAESEVKENDEVTIKIQDTEYKYKAAANDSLFMIIFNMVAAINAGTGDPNVIATSNLTTMQIILTSRVGGESGNLITYSSTVTDGAEWTATAAGSTLLGGQDATKLAAGTIISIVGNSLSEDTAAAPEDADPLPFDLANVQVFVDGYRLPLFFVSPGLINAQLPWEVSDALSSSAVVRVAKKDGTVEMSSAVAVPIIPQNPAIYAVGGGIDPRPGIFFHGSSYATGMISVDGTVTAGNIARINIADRAYTYTAVEGDTLEKVRDGLINAVNSYPDPDIVVSAAGVFTRILLQARRPGPELNGLPYSVAVSDGATIILSPSNTGLCCANIEDSPITLQNPAVPGERIKIYATGLGQINPTEARGFVKTGFRYYGPVQNEPVEFVSSLAGGKTANVLFARLMQGRVGMYEIVLELNADLPTNAETQVTIAQSFQVSNIVRFPLKNPNDGISLPAN